MAVRSSCHRVAPGLIKGERVFIIERDINSALDAGNNIISIMLTKPRVVCGEWVQKLRGLVRHRLGYRNTKYNRLLFRLYWSFQDFQSKKLFKHLLRMGNV